MARIHRDAAYTVLSLLLGAVLAVVGAVLWQSSDGSATSVTEYERLLALGASVLGLGAMTWWVFALTLALASAVLRCYGRARAADRLGSACPGFMRRLAVALLSAQLLTGPAALAQASPQPTVADVAAAEVAAADVAGQKSRVPMPPQARTSRRPSQVSPQPAPTGPDMTGPIDPAWMPKPVSPPAGPLTRPPRETAPPAAPASSRSGSSPAAPSPAAPSPAAPRPVVPSPAAHASGRHAPPDATAVGTGGTRTVVVRRGDTLWSISAEHLGPDAGDLDVALAWPRWYAANRAVIGPDPDVLLPGQVLRVPSGTG